MAHSVELLFDENTDAAIRRQWSALADAGLPSQANHTSPSNRPHVTLSVAQRIDSAVDATLREPGRQLPLDCLIGAPLIFGRKSVTLARLIVPTAELLRLHRSVDSICAPHLPSAPFAHARPGHWSPHVTLARRLAPADLAAALEAIDADDIPGTFAGLRRWDGDARVDTVIA
ncbi:2'-5' RNA ligase family protein [Mycolicibacterium hodleri]|uniref:2'-5' RNA ligase family protein n=1 Tax=Mycolicibacterium hodleri TaxID=49897 RepID=A0A502E5L2_9MYCO|nr:2'-5' RNA ligase family protein [Mycolicibacterium hodleri]TPG32239.1 2'-5' RNA ligase family protein [Mycolicibacterium hodleri]